MSKVLIQYTNPPITISKQVDIPFYFKRISPEGMTQFYKIQEDYAVIATDTYVSVVHFDNVISYLSSVDDMYNIGTNMVDSQLYNDQLARFYYHIKKL